MKVGFVSIIGRPNVGKSTLLNKVLDYKVSITSSTPQTTRDQIKGIYNDEESQIIFIDTPGIHKPKQLLGESLNEVSYKSIKEADLVLYLQPGDEKIGPGDRLIIESMKEVKSKVAVITKLDLINPDDAKNKAMELKALGFTEVIGVSVQMRNSISAFVDFIKTKLPEGHQLYGEDDITDMSMRFISKEIIRESVIENLTDEIPHSIGVIVDSFNEPDDTSSHYSISATIFVERESQKGIVVGANGKKIKAIGIASREKIETMLGEKVFLSLKVKVNKKWTSDAEQIKKMGY